MSEETNRSDGDKPAVPSNPLLGRGQPHIGCANTRTIRERRKRMDKKNCSGCYNNFYNYNGNNPHGVKECWNLKTAKMVWRVRVGNFEEPKYYKGRKAIRVPDCYHTGSCGDKFLDPSCAK